MHQLKIKYDEKGSKVLQIASAIARDIEKGILAKDTKLPSINVFSKRYNVARDTIEKAYKELKNNGYIISVASRGYFVSGRKDSKIKVLLI